MIRFVTIGGHSRAWRFSGTEALRAWCAGRPWLAGGGTLTVAVTSPSDADAFESELRRELRAHDDGASDPMIARCNLSAGDDALTSLLAALDLSPHPSLLTRLTVLAEALASRAVVFVARDVSGGTSGSTTEDVGVVADEVRKVRAAARLSIVFLRWDRAPVGGAVASFRCGFPDGDVLDGTARLGVWRRYIHTRAAWECAGDPEMAVRWSNRGLGQALLDRDDDVESLLGRLSAEEVRDRGIDAASAVAEIRAAIARNGGAADLQALAALVETGAVWRPPGGPRWKPSPWFARAVLLSGGGGKLGALLRGSLVCAPLAHELLERCLQLERFERAACHARGGQVDPPEQVRVRFEEFRRGAPRSDRRHYPGSCPALPDDGWYFAGLGEFLAAFGNDEGLGRSRRDLHDLRDLRNALAHGRYVSWYAVDRLMRIERALSG